MPWVRFDDSAPDDPKLDALSDGAFRLWFNAICYSNRNLTDGFVPIARVPRLTPRYRSSHLDELLNAGAWHKEADGVRIHGYLDYQPSSQQIAEQREYERERKARRRKSGRASTANDPDTGQFVSRPMSHRDNHRDSHRDIPQNGATVRREPGRVTVGNATDLRSETDAENEGLCGATTPTTSGDTRMSRRDSHRDSALVSPATQPNPTQPSIDSPPLQNPVLARPPTEEEEESAFAEARRRLANRIGPPVNDPDAWVRTTAARLAIEGYAKSEPTRATTYQRPDCATCDGLSLVEGDDGYIPCPTCTRSDTA